jgi:aspartate/methionine/tyrosine aminotransferase
MEVGQPGTGAPQPVIDASKHALDTDKLGYTSSLGIVQLREKISKYYAEKYKVDVPMERIIITTGSSAAFMLSFLGLFDKDDVIALCSSGYPCYRNIMKATDLDAATIMINSDFKVTAKELSVEIARRAAASLPPLKGLILSSPGNPTGAMLSPVELRDLCALCEENDIQFISDEIYHGITYGTQTETTALSVTDQAVVINSFSKYFSMTGWRLGWMVVPPHLVDVMNRLNQNMFINAPTLSQASDGDF